MGFMLPCCICGTMLTSRVQSRAYKVNRQIKFNHTGEVTLHQELGHSRPVCDSCVSRMQGEGFAFHKDGTIVKHYAEDGTSVLRPTPDIPLPERTKSLPVSIKIPRVLSYKDVLVTYLLEGLPGLQRLHEERLAKPPTFWRALRHLRNAGKPYQELEEWCQLYLKGHRSPVTGMRRAYRAQQLRSSAPFIRLPVEALGARKGQLLGVSFEDGKLVVTKL